MRAGSRIRAAAAAVAVAGMLAAGCGLAPSASEAAGVGGSSGAPRPQQPGPSAPPAAVPPDTEAELADFYRQQLDWEPCGRGGFECTTIDVPLDYADPDGDTIEIAVIRLLALRQDEKIGSLLINPGGPGGSGVEYARYAPLILGESLRQNYDVVGFDPRGVGQSTPITCQTDVQRDEMLAASATPDDSAELAELVGLAQRFADRCAERSGDLLGHVSTVEAARDMDVLRGALGDKELHYLGASYGTFLGATYADLFPDRAGRLVLDGAVDPSLTGLQLSLEQAKGFEVALRAFMADCVARSDCPLGGDLDTAYDTLDGLLAGLDEQPLPTDSDRELTAALGETGLIMPLYVESLWPRLRGALDRALGGDGSGLLSMADEYSDRGPNGYKSNAGEAIYAVNCLDRAELNSIKEAQALEDEFAAASPRFGISILWGSLPCAVWPEEATGQAREIDAAGAAPILVVGTTRDPATPYEWSVRLAEQLDSGVLLTRDGDGHTAYGSLNACIDTTVEAFLVDGKVPEDGKTC